MLVLEMRAGGWAGRGLIRSLLAGGSESSCKATSLWIKTAGSRHNPVGKPYYKLDGGGGLLNLAPCLFPGSFPINSYPREHVSLNKDCFPKNSPTTLGAPGTGPKGLSVMNWWSVDMTAFREGSKCAPQKWCEWQCRQSECLREVAWESTDEAVWDEYYSTQWRLDITRGKY